MAIDTWTAGIDGNWVDGSKWSLGAPPTAAQDARFVAAGAYTVTVNTAVVAHSLVVNAAGAELYEGQGSLHITGAVDLVAGRMALHGANALGAFNQSGGVLYLFNAAALGSAALKLTGGELSRMVNESIGAALNLGGGGFTIDAATGVTATLGGGTWSLDTTANPTLQFGSASRAGTLVWRTPFASISGAGYYNVDVAGGTLKAGDASFGYLLGNDNSTNIAAGATIDLAGFSAAINGAVGAGRILDSGAAATLKLAGADFRGAIGGAIAVEIVTDSAFQSANSYSQGTKIDSGAALYLEDAGRIAGAIADNGSLYNADLSGVVTLGAIGGAGSVTQEGASTLVLDHADTYSGGTKILQGEIAIGAGGALGSGAVVLDNAELLATATLTMADAITLRDKATLAAATGKTLTITSTANMTWDASAAPLTVVFGDSTHKGIVLLTTSSRTIAPAKGIHVDVADGTAKDGDGSLAIFTEFADDVRVAAGATLDAGGLELITTNLTCAGTIANSSATAATLLTQGVCAVSGAITANLGVNVANGTLKLSGADTSTGPVTIGGGATLQLGVGGASGSIAGPIEDKGSLVIYETGAVALGGVISGAGALVQVGGGSTRLNGANTYSGGTTLEHGELIVANGKALGSGSVTLDGGELLATASMSLAATQNGANSFTFSGADIIAAAHGATLSIGGAPAHFGAATLEFGQGGADGTVIFKAGGGAVVPGPFTIRVNAGTLRIGDSVFGNVTSAAKSLTIAAGATLDLAGFAAEAKSIYGAGTVTNSSATTAYFYIDAGAFGGVIEGNTGLYVVGKAILTGANTYTPITVIGSGGTLQLGAGDAAGSLVSSIDDMGSLVIDETGSVTLDGTISGAGGLTQAGTGVTTLGGGNSYTGGARIQRGELVAASFAAVGAVAFTGSTGVLRLDQSQSYGGTITGFSKTGTMSLELGDIAFISKVTKATYSGTTTSGVLTVTDGTHTAHIKFAGDYIGSTFTVSAASQGGVEIVDPFKGSAHKKVDAGNLHPFIQAASSFAVSAVGSIDAASCAWRQPPPALSTPRAHIA